MKYTSTKFYFLSTTELLISKLSLLSLQALMLARIFQPSLLRKPGMPMAAALVPAFAGMSSMHAYCSTLYSKPALPHQPSRLSRRESDAISGLPLYPSFVTSLAVSSTWEYLALAADDCV